MPPGSMAIFGNRKPFHNEEETISTGGSSSYAGIRHSGRAVQTQPGSEGREPRGPLSNVVLWMRHSAANTCSQASRLRLCLPCCVEPDSRFLGSYSHSV